MRVIFIQDVGGVGQRGAIKDVADGYAMNFLIPRGLAKQATADTVKHHEAAQAKEVSERRAQADALAKAVQALEGARVEIPVRATEKGGLFKSIGAKEITSAIQSKVGTILPVEAIALEKPIKQTGEHAVLVKAAGAQARIVVVVAAA